MIHDGHRIHTPLLTNLSATKRLEARLKDHPLLAARWLRSHEAAPLDLPLPPDIARRVAELPANCNPKPVTMSGGLIDED